MPVIIPENNISAAALKDLFQRELHCLEKLLELLDSELNALDEKNFSEITRLVAEKSLCVEQLEGLERQRSAIAGPAHSHTRLAATLYPQDTELSALAGSIAAKTAECQLKNQRNGLLINKQEQLAQRTLKAIRPGSTDTPTYSKSGGNHSDQTSRPLGKA